ncbi:MAG: DUF4352 domain-containing protein [Enterococcus sp.]
MATRSSGNTKKPFYKKVWFWVIVVIVIAGIGTSSSENGGEKVSAGENSSSESSSKETEYYQIGDSVKVDDVTYTLNNVSLTDERNILLDESPENVVKIEYTVKNDSDDDVTVGADVEVYDADDAKCKTYANENTMNTIASGKQMDAVAHFAVGTTGEIEIQFSPLMSFDKAASFKATV